MNSRMAMGSNLRRVLHIEVGGAYGGSTKGLELYLRNADWHRFDHRVLFYYPTPGMRLLEELAKTSVLTASPPKARSSVIRHFSYSLARNQLLSDALSVIKERPLVGKLVRFMQSERPDLVHINNTFTYQPASILAAERIGIPVVAHVRNPVKLSPVIKSLARRLDCFVVVNQTLADSLRGYPVRLVREAIEPKPPPPEAVAETRRLLGGEGVIVGSVGRLEEQKGYEYLIRAAQIVCSTRPDVLFVVAGDGQLRAHLQGLIDSLGLSGRFRLLGFRTDTDVVTSAFDLYVCSSLWEGTGLSPLDAMALGTPVVGTRVGVLPEVLVDDKTGWLVEPGNAQALARRIIDATAISAEARRRITVAAKSAVAPFQDVKGLARQFEAVL